MKLSEIKKVLGTVTTINFQLPDGTFVPEYFHVTEVGLITKNFIDCGGNLRNETVVNFQLWDANDFDHRLKPQKLLNIIQLSEKVLEIGDHEVEVEYQDATIGRYELAFNGVCFELINKKTACLASDKCGIIQPNLDPTFTEKPNSCQPGDGCC